MAIVDVMRVQIVSVSPRASVHEAIDRMLDENTGAVAVVDEGRLVGILSERDVLRLSGTGAPFAHRWVGDVMTTALVTVGPDVSIADAARLMGERKIRHLPIVEEDRLLGMVSMREVMGLLVSRVWESHDETAHETVRRLLG
jgi:CBS domain-containing protein